MFYIYYLKRVSSLHCCDLIITKSQNRNFGAYFAGSPYLPHGLNGIVISNQAKIGKGVTILQQVTIGVKYIGGKASLVGDDVLIGAGAKVLGEIKIGNHVRIGANAVVLTDVPDGATAVGNPAKIIKKGE